MRPGRLIGRMTFLSIALLLQSTGHATRPLSYVAGLFDDPQLQVTQPLSEALSGRFLALDGESLALRQDVIRQAKLYRNARHGGTLARRTFLRQCETASVRNVFCALEIESAAEISSQGSRDRTTSRGDIAPIVSALRAADLSRLQVYSSHELRRGLSRFDEFAPLRTLSRQLVATDTCDLDSLSHALASKVEEFFPDPEIVERAKDLYRKVASCSSSGTALSARFRHALLSIWLKKDTEADESLRILSRLPEASSYHSRAKFWRHHLATLGQDAETAREMRESLWRDHTLTFHNLAINGDDPRLQALLVNVEEPLVRARSRIRPDLNSFLMGFEALVILGDRVLAGEFADRLTGRLGSVEADVRLYVAALLHREGATLPKFRILTTLFQDAPSLLGRATLELLFPRRYQEFLRPKANEVDPLLILSLIRQESAFNANARSVAGARGLMQVMPSTARSFASVRRDRLFDPRINIDVGTRYFLHRLERYKGDVELTLAAYNAGFTRVDRWVRRYPLENKLLFMDLIPFRETREYVSSILRNYFWYSSLYDSPSGGPEFEHRPADDVRKIRSILEANAGRRAALPQSL